jgi:hypothetical protein
LQKLAQVRGNTVLLARLSSKHDFVRRHSGGQRPVLLLVHSKGDVGKGTYKLSQIISFLLSCQLFLEDSITMLNTPLQLWMLRPAVSNFDTFSFKQLL